MTFNPQFFSTSEITNLNLVSFNPFHDGEVARSSLRPSSRRVFCWLWHKDFMQTMENECRLLSVIIGTCQWAFRHAQRKQNDKGKKAQASKRNILNPIWLHSVLYIFHKDLSNIHKRDHYSPRTEQCLGSGLCSHLSFTEQALLLPALMSLLNGSLVAWFPRPGMSLSKSESSWNGDSSVVLPDATIQNEVIRDFYFILYISL